MADEPDWTDRLLDALVAAPTPGAWYVLLTTALRAHIQSIHNDINESVDGVEHLPEVALDTSALGLAWQATRVKSMPLMDRRIALAQVFVALDRHLFTDNSWNPRDPLPGVEGQPHHGVARTTVLACRVRSTPNASRARSSASPTSWVTRCELIS